MGASQLLVGLWKPCPLSVSRRDHSSLNFPFHPVLQFSFCPELLCPPTFTELSFAFWLSYPKLPCSGITPPGMWLWGEWLGLGDVGLNGE